jgi:hypothetical protein
MDVPAQVAGIGDSVGRPAVAAAARHQRGAAVSADAVRAEVTHASTCPTSRRRWRPTEALVAANRAWPAGAEAQASGSPTAAAVPG